ncbi:hypothetical protein PILCRDRAFT_12698 [Piloderma croceum F 1598]|uniref:Uncharacterized protein n=1 Tax=Piloderma croceum (strain F 1598) TaxID=765440 RepID=A0A0C3F9M8_PILCF|nr:hypothetical protein PILCRDRAFT_12698 [Piloderma croceum F 1598]
MPIPSQNKWSCLTTILEGTPIKAHAPRNPELPQMYEVFDHTLQLNQWSILFLTDLTIEGQMKAFEVQNHQCILGPVFDNAINSGAVFVNPRDCIYTGHAQDYPKEDKTHNWVVAK